MPSKIQPLPGRRAGGREVGRPIPDLDRRDLELLAGLTAVGLVPFAGLSVGAHESGGRLLLGAALLLVSGGQLLAGLRRIAAGGRPHGLRIPGSRLLLLRSHLGPGAPVRPPVTGRP